MIFCPELDFNLMFFAAVINFGVSKFQQLCPKICGSLLKGPPSSNYHSGARPHSRFFAQLLRDYRALALEFPKLLRDLILTAGPHSCFLLPLICQVRQ